jgi:hypothetical protein
VLLAVFVVMLVVTAVASEAAILLLGAPPSTPAGQNDGRGLKLIALMKARAPFAQIGF